MFDNVHKLFQDWDARMVREKSQSPSYPSISTPQKIDGDIETKETSYKTLDRNSQSTLSSILYTNQRHRKQEIPLNFEVDETTGILKDVDVISRITPFTSDKTSLMVEGGATPATATAATPATTATAVTSNGNWDGWRRLPQGTTKGAPPVFQTSTSKSTSAFAFKNWPKTAKTIKYRLICDFIDTMVELSDDRKEHIKGAFRRCFDKCVDNVTLDYKKRVIVGIDINAPIFE
jgi:hypothetical protein